MAWLVLLIAGMLEAVWVVAMKYSHGFTRLWPSVWTIVAMVGSVGGLAWTMKSLPVSTVYPIWTGVGTAATAVLGIMLFDESRNPWRLACIGLIVAGILGLRLLR